jgi:rhamnosyltransferase
MTMADPGSATPTAAPSTPANATTGGSAGLAIAAVLTAYHPDERLAAVVEAALLTCDAVIVADNTPADSGSMAEKLDDPRVKVLRSGRNLGVAAALNLGVAALPADAAAVLFLDQDSVLPAELVHGLAAHLDDPSIGVIGPAAVEVGSGTAYESLSGLHKEVSNRYAVITSGMVVRRSCFDLVPEFREDFFVDYVDVDFCLKLRRAGVRVVRDKSLVLPHSIGDGREHKVLGRTVKVIHYPAWRHYWTARNGVILIREHGLRQPGFALTNALFMARWLVVTALFEPKRRTHVPAFLRGLLNGLTGRTTLKYLPGGAEYRPAGGGATTTTAATAEA